MINDLKSAVFRVHYLVAINGNGLEIPAQPDRFGPLPGNPARNQVRPRQYRQNGNHHHVPVFLRLPAEAVFERTIILLMEEKKQLRISEFCDEQIEIWCNAFHLSRGCLTLD